MACFRIRENAVSLDMVNFQVCQVQIGWIVAYALGLRIFVRGIIDEQHFIVGRSIDEALIGAIATAWDYPWLFDAI